MFGGQNSIFNKHDVSTGPFGSDAAMQSGQRAVTIDRPLPRTGLKSCLCAASAGASHTWGIHEIELRLVLLTITLSDSLAGCRSFILSTAPEYIGHFHQPPAFQYKGCYSTPPEAPATEHRDQ